MVRNVIFDLCGPIITIDIRRIDQSLHRLGATAEEPYIELYRAGVTKLFESNAMSPHAFFDSVRFLLNISASNDDIANAWNSLIVNFDLRHAAFVQQIHANHPTFLLSNSDIVNARHFHHFLNTRAGFPFIEQCFNQVYFSYSVGMRKPDPSIFRHVVEQNGLKAEETLVIDDCLKHCLGAREAGLQAHHLVPGQSILQLTHLIN